MTQPVLLMNTYKYFKAWSDCIIYQYNTGSHRYPISYGSFYPIFWVAVAPPIFVANKIWAHLEKPWEPSIDPVLFLFWLHIIWRRMMTNHSLPSYIYFLRMQQFQLYVFGAPDVEVVLELPEYHFWRNSWCMTFDEWFTYDLLFIFRIYHGE